MEKRSREYMKKRTNEHYFKKAKTIKVRARSYFKLEEINNKFSIIKENMNIIDLGSAPGGWLEYLDKKLKFGNIIGIDLLEIKKQNEFSKKITIIEDNFKNIEKYLNKNNEYFDLVLSDMAPEFSGDSFLDKGKTHKLNIETLNFSEKYLKKNGTLVFKTFEGEDLKFVREKAKKLFKNIKEYKPKSSQRKSAETFIICTNKR